MAKETLRISTERVYGYQPQSKAFEALVDRLWPRGISKEKLSGVEWFKAVSPSTDLREEFHHEHMSFADFRTKFEQELKDSDAPQKLLEAAQKSGKSELILLYSAKNTQENNAVVLREYLEQLQKD